MHLICFLNKSIYPTTKQKRKGQPSLLHLSIWEKRVKLACVAGGSNVTLPLGQLWARGASGTATDPSTHPSLRVTTLFFLHLFYFYRCTTHTLLPPPHPCRQFEEPISERSLSLIAANLMTKHHFMNLTSSYNGRTTANFSAQRRSDRKLQKL